MSQHEEVLFPEKVLKFPDGSSITIPVYEDDDKDYSPRQSDSIPFGSLVCQCCHMNWSDPLKNGGICEYTYTNGDKYKQLETHPVFGMICADKTNMDMVSCREMSQVCKYQLGTGKCALPNDVHEDMLWFLKRGRGGGDYDERFDKNHENYYKNHFTSVREMFLDHDRNERKV